VYLVHENLFLLGRLVPSIAHAHHPVNYEKLKCLQLDLLNTVHSRCYNLSGEGMSQAASLANDLMLDDVQLVTLTINWCLLRNYHYALRGYHAAQKTSGSFSVISDGK
jgi:hypothetical protein